MEDHEIFKNITILSLEQATVLPYLTYRLALDVPRSFEWSTLSMAIHIEGLAKTG